MELSLRYRGHSALVPGPDGAFMHLSANLARDPTLFHGVLGHPIVLREALATLHQVVISNLNSQSRRLARRQAQAFADANSESQSEDERILASLIAAKPQNQARIGALRARLDEIHRQFAVRSRTYNAACQRYFQYLANHWWERQLVLDPVITVHHDEMFWEAFSRDESLYARLSINYENFHDISDVAYGTTNIDFSLKLHEELDKLRTYRRTRMAIGAAGLGIRQSVRPGFPSNENLSHGESEHFEKKIDVPATWVRGFLQVQAVTALRLERFTMSPVDLYNILYTLRKRKARESPRALRYELTPGEPVRVAVEPWNETWTLSRQSIYDGPVPLSIRTWGRDRLAVLERLLPVAQRVTVYLAGTGLPSLYHVDLGSAQFTLALSGWTDQDWSRSRKQDPKGANSDTGVGFETLWLPCSVTPAQLEVLSQCLHRRRHAHEETLSAELGMDPTAVRAGLLQLCREGRAMADLNQGGYRDRNLFPSLREAAPTSKPDAPRAPTDPRDAAVWNDAQSLLDRGNVRLWIRPQPANGDVNANAGAEIFGIVRDDLGREFEPQLRCDNQDRAYGHSCNCRMFHRHGLTQGPCLHLMAIHLAYHQTQKPSIPPNPAFLTRGLDSTAIGG